MMTLNILIFSRNRACQLHCLFQSIKDNLAFPSVETFVLYRFDDTSFKKGYEKLRASKVLDSIHWIGESFFRKQLMSILTRLNKRDFLMFLVDDNVVFRPFKDTIIFEVFSASHLFVSTRCSRKYAKGRIPSFDVTGGYLEWTWNYSPDTYTGWNYPFSLDGNIYELGFLLPLLEKLNFRAPNSLERALFVNRFDPYVLSRPKALALREPAVLNIPLNRVQEEWSTWHGDVSSVELNEKYLQGFLIDNQALYRVQPTDYHYLVAPNWIRA